MTSIEELHQRWMADPEYRAAHAASEAEFALAGELIAARAKAGLTQEQLAERMGTTQSAIARLEGGKQLPSMKTLERFAQATGTRIVLHFEPATKAAAE